MTEDEMQQLVAEHPGESAGIKLAYVLEAIPLPEVPEEMKELLAITSRLIREIGDETRIG